MLSPAKRLAALLIDLSKDRQKKIILIGHSLGGLLAASAANMLAIQGHNDLVRIITLGTPWEGSIRTLLWYRTGRQIGLNRSLGSFENVRSWCSAAAALPKVATFHVDGVEHRLSLLQPEDWNPFADWRRQLVRANSSSTVGSTLSCKCKMGRSTSNFSSSGNSNPSNADSTSSNESNESVVNPELLEKARSFHSSIRDPAPCTPMVIIYNPSHPTLAGFNIKGGVENLGQAEWSSKTHRFAPGDNLVTEESAKAVPNKEAVLAFLKTDRAHGPMLTDRGRLTEALCIICSHDNRCNGT